MGLLVDAVIRQIEEIARSKSFPAGWKVAKKVNAFGHLVIALVIPPRPGDPNQWRTEFDEDEGSKAEERLARVLRRHQR